MKIANSESRGETQNAVPIMPPQKNSPTLPAVGALPGSDAHREAEAEAVAGPEQEVASVDLGAEMVARHEGERSRAEDAHAVERAAVAQHGGEARIVGDRRQEAAAAEFEFRRRRRVHGSTRAASMTSNGNGSARRASFRVGREEGGVGHAERLEDASLQDFAERAPSTISTTRPSTSVDSYIPRPRRAGA